MQCVANKNWGADRKSLCNLYLATIQSKMNYGDFIYGSAAPCHLDKLNSIQYKGLRIIGGNLRCTPKYSLEPEMNILPLKHRRNLNGLKYMGRVYRVETHPTRLCFEDYFHFEYYDQRILKGAFQLPVVDKLKALTN